MLYWLQDNFVCRKVVTLYLFELNFVSSYLLVAIGTPVFLLQGRRTPVSPGTCAAFCVSDPFLSAPLAALTVWSRTLVVLLASCSCQESCRLQEEFYGKHLIIGYGWTYTNTPSDQCNPLFTGIIWLYFLFTQGGLGGVLCTWYQKNSLLHLGAAHVLERTRPEGSCSAWYRAFPHVGSIRLSPVSVWASRLQSPSNLQDVAKHSVTFLFYSGNRWVCRAAASRLNTANLLSKQWIPPGAAPYLHINIWSFVSNLQICNE